MKSWVESFGWVVDLDIEATRLAEMIEFRFTGFEEVGWGVECEQGPTGSISPNWDVTLVCTSQIVLKCQWLIMAAAEGQMRYCTSQCSCLRSSASLPASNQRFDKNAFVSGFEFSDFMSNLWILREPFRGVFVVTVRVYRCRHIMQFLFLVIFLPF